MKKTLVLLILFFTVYLSGFSPVFSQDTAKTRSKISAAVPAQSPAPVEVADPSLNGQFQDILKKSKTLSGFKLINPARLNAFWRSVRDSIGTEKKKNSALSQKLQAQQTKIDQLQAEALQNKANLEQSEAAVNQVSLLGMPVDKTTYNTTMWGAVILLAAALVFAIFTASKNVREARYRHQLFDELSAEYHNFKVKANEKEKKLARELQTERNRLEELLNKGS